MKKHCKDCPMFQETEFAQQAVNYGCLPVYGEALKWKRDTGKIWACHCNPEKPCKGFTELMDKYKEPYDLNNDLITEDTTLEEIYENVDAKPKDAL